MDIHSNNISGKAGKYGPAKKREDYETTHRKKKRGNLENIVKILQKKIVEIHGKGEL